MNTVTIPRPDVLSGRVNTKGNGRDIFQINGRAIVQPNHQLFHLFHTS
ncbi:Uncharacterised protein [Vibrio cholerae]|uniref:Uncharacterized protein n=1 Tax=Vibrio cholerae TaxID=666 RepID=A0A655TXK2_VIBCL|nr:Uncharacterised protein [Vibrio cholerae]CRZ82876.1 Uncharacterised protein [Vibrio cholerae]CSB11017.1 Uncharacterised protein [Vibrio cholerae]CSB41409.1 Uncharacterised protein [Vibrio cholerae]CSC34094.1 Uncharacterised protein [Vibrio cholerae]